MVNTHEVASAGHGTLKSYIIGFILSIALTIIPYYLVVSHAALPEHTIIVSIVLIGVIQLLVQLIFFLHLGLSPSQRWNLMTFVFTVLIVGILVVGSLWIMYNLDYNMMDHPVVMHAS